MEATMTRMRHIVALVVTAAVLGTSAPALAAKDYRAERYDVKLALQPDGSMQVTEAITFAFGPDSFTYVTREIPTRRTDGIQILGVSIDGRPLTPGKEAGQYEVKRADNGRRRIVWHFEPVTATTRTFQVTFMVQGLVELSEPADLVRWRILPSDHDYVIACASVSLSYPPAASLLEPPVLDPAPTRTSVEGTALAYERCPVAPDDSWLLSARFAPRSLSAAPPSWQERSLRHATYLPTFLGLAVLILVGGVIGFVVFGLNHRPDVRSDSSSRLPEKPGDEPAGFAIALAHGGSVQGQTALAALLDLAARGAIRIEEAEPGSRFTRHEFRILPGDRSLARAEHERELIDLLFRTKSGSRSSVKLSEFGKILQSPGRWNRFTQAVRGDLRSSGLIDPAREHTRSTVNAVAIGLILLAVVGFIATAPFVNQMGPASLLMAGAVLLVALSGFIVASTLPMLTDAGQRRAGLWAAHGRYLKDLGKGRATPPSADMFGRALPYAAGFGVAVAWAKALEKHGMKTGAPWLQALARHEDSGGNMAATIAMLSAGQSASGHTSAAGAGAAGGGSSSAG
jgi:hypothetical protein